MGVASVEGDARRRPHARRAAPPREDAAATAWVVSVPCALVAVAAVVLLGPPLSRLLYPAQLPFTPLGNELSPTLGFTPEPLEGTRYLLALAAPVLLALATALAWPRLSLDARVERALVALAQLLGAALVVVCLAEQRHDQARWYLVYFNDRTLLAGALLAAAALAALRDARVRARLARLLRESPRRRRALTLVAVALTALWLLPGVNSERSVAWAMNYHDFAFYLDETMAVVNGLTPLHDFTAQYASLLPLPLALALAVLGKTLLAYSIVVCALGALSLLAIWGVLRRLAGGATAALALYLPFMATSLFTIFSAQHMVLRFTAGTYFPSIPFRYGGPFALAWLLTRHLSGERPTRAWPLFLAAGVVVIDNPEFGVPALGASAVALLLARAPDGSGRGLARLAGEAAAGLALAYAVVAAVLLARAGALPDLAGAFEFSRQYGIGGFGTTPLVSALGVPLVIFLTHVAAIGAGAVRALERRPGRPLTSMLVWSGIFGLGSATYYVARSNFVALGATFPAWALSLALLALVVVERLAREGARRPTLAAFATLMGVGVMACSLVQAPRPWSQLARIDQMPAGADLNPLGLTYDPPQTPAARRFVAALADGDRFVLRRGAPVAILATTGHLYADAYGVADVVPFTGLESIHTQEQLDATLDTLRRRGGNTALVEPAGVRKVRATFRRRGFALLTRSGLRASWPAQQPLPDDAIVQADLVKFVDTRQPHAPALD